MSRAPMQNEVRNRIAQRHQYVKIWRRAERRAHKHSLAGTDPGAKDRRGDSGTEGELGQGIHGLGRSINVG